MAHGIPKYKRIEQLKKQSALVAAGSQQYCQDWLKNSKDGERTYARFPFKFYARLLGLRNGDLNWRADH